MIDIQELCKFLTKAKKATYASGEETKKIKEEDLSTTLVFEENNRKYHDNYFGGAPYGWREVVFFEGKPIYMMTYYGWVNENVVDINWVYKTIQHALLLIPEEKPYRGPEIYKEWEYTYTNSFSGKVDNFFGEESIKHNGKEIYKAKYMGGLVDQRKWLNGKKCVAEILDIDKIRNKFKLSIFS